MPRVAALLLMSLALPALACERGTLTSHVTYVRDGDTLEFGGIPISLQGLAAPEWDEPNGKAARDAMMELVHGRVLRCELDGTRTYDRCAGVCYLDGQDVAALLVQQGLARDCPRYSGGRYAVLEAQAAAEGATIRERYKLPKYCRPRVPPNCQGGTQGAFDASLASCATSAWQFSIA